MVETRRRVQLDDSCEEFIGLYLHEPRIQADTHSGPGRRGIVGQRSAGVYFFLDFHTPRAVLYRRQPVEANRFYPCVLSLPGSS